MESVFKDFKVDRDFRRSWDPFRCYKATISKSINLSSSEPVSIYTRAVNWAFLNIICFLMLTKIYNVSESESISGIEALQKNGITKEELVRRMREGDNSAAILLYLGLVSNKYKTFTEDFEDEDTGETVKIERKIVTDECLFESEQSERKELETKISSIAGELSEKSLHMCWRLFEKDKLPISIVSALADKGNSSALEWLGDYYAGNFSSDFQFPVDKIKAADYYGKAFQAGLSKEEYDLDSLRLEYGVKHSDSFDWVYKSDAFTMFESDFNDYLRNINSFPNSDWTYLTCWTKVVDNLYFGKFPGPMAQSMWTEYEEVCTVEDLKAELISRGVPESHFKQLKKGILVDLKNISFYLSDYARFDKEAKEGVLTTAWIYTHEWDPIDEDLYCGMECLYGPEIFAETLCDVDEDVPAVKLAVRLIYDKLMEELADKPKLEAQAWDFLESVFGGIVPAEISSVTVEYRYGDEGKRHKFCREVVCVDYNRDLLSSYGGWYGHGIEIDLEDFTKIPKAFFDWYVHLIETDHLETELSYRLEIRQDEDGNEMLVIIDRERCEKLLTTRLDSLTYDQLVSMRPF